MSEKMGRGLLVAVILIAAFARFWSLGSTELLHDEGLDAFRGIGYLDYLESSGQPTPIQLLKDGRLPWWVSLSTHDAPPLFFWVERVSFAIFGDTLFAARLPSALAGAASVFLVFLIVRRLLASLEERTRTVFALLAAFTLAIDPAHIWVSRLAMLDGMLIFFALLNVHFFLRFYEDERRWMGFGVTLGLVALTKYTGIFLVPLYLLFIVQSRPTILRTRFLYFSLLTAFVLFLPVVVYNIGMYKAFGHFDLQIAHLLGQEVPYWQGESGKTMDTWKELPQNVRSVFSLPFITLMLGALLFMFVVLARKDSEFEELRKEYVSFAVSLAISLAILFFLIGSAVRFIALIAVFGSLSLAFAAYVLWRRLRGKGSRIGALVVLLIFFAYQAYFAAYTLWPVLTSDFGVAKLDRYFDSIFKGGRPEALPRHPNPHLDRVIKKYAERTPVVLPPVGIVYDETIQNGARLWLFARRQYYHGIPIMPARTFLELVRSGDATALSGYTLYFVKAEAGAPLEQSGLVYAEEVEVLLRKGGKKPDLRLSDGSGVPTFVVYAFSID